MSLSPRPKHNYTVVIADDHPLTLMGLEQALGKISWLTVKAKGQNGQEAFEAISKWKPDFAILDIQMPEMNGLEIAERLSKEGTKTNIILLTMFRELSFFEKAKQLNVRGYLLKDSMLKEIENCLENILSGKDYLSKTMNTLYKEIEEKQGALKVLSRMEKNVFQLIGEQKTSKEIADLLYLSPRTIDNHRYNICKKLKIGGGSNALLKYAITMCT